MCHLQADVGRYEGAVHLIKAVHGCCPDPHLWLQTPPMSIRGLCKKIKNMGNCYFTTTLSSIRWTLMMMDLCMYIKRLNYSLPWVRVRASALIAAFLQTARTSSPSPSPRNPLPAQRGQQKHTRLSSTQWWNTDVPSVLVFVSTHLPDVPHLILKVIDRPFPCHHLLLSVRDLPLHHTVHFGPMVLWRGLWHPIGRVFVELRETGSQRSGFCTGSCWGCPCSCVFVKACMFKHEHLHPFTCGCACLHMCTWSGISSTAAAELETGGW